MRSAWTSSRVAQGLDQPSPPKAVERANDFVELVKWRIGAEGRIAEVKRQHGFDRARIRGLTGARIWCGWGRALPKRNPDRRPSI